MFPLPRMLEYGNVVIQKEIQKIDTVYGTLYLLYSTGELYAIGRNASYNIGTGTNTSVKEWYLMSTDVADFFISNSSDIGCIVKKKDGSWWHCGSLGIFGISGAGANTVLTNVDSYLSVLNNGYDELYMNGGNIWYRKGSQYFRMGNNGNYNLLTGNATNLTSFTEYVLPQGTKAIFPGDIGTIVTYTDGTVKAIGNNGTSRFGLPNRQTYTTLTTIPIPEIQKIFYGRTSTWFFTVSQGLWAGGVCKYGQLGNGLNDLNTYVSSTQIRTTNPVALSNGDGCTIMHYQDPSVGAGIQYRMGNGSTATTASFIDLFPGYPLNIIINDNCSYYYDGTILYGTGQIPASKDNLLPGYTTNQTSFVPLDIPR